MFEPLHCSHFGVCGGCSRLDQPIDVQLQAHAAHAETLLGDLLDGVAPTITLPPRTPRHDRTTLLYPVQERSGRIDLGIYRRGTHLVEPIADCRVQHKALTQFGVRVRELLPKLGVPAYDETRGRGLLRAVRARVMAKSSELLVGAVTTAADFAGRDRLAEALWNAAQGLRDDQGRMLTPVGVALNVNPKPGNALLGAETFALRGRDWQLEPVGPRTLRVSFASFWQLHRHADAILFRPALLLLGDVTGLEIVDGYGGVGAFAVRLLDRGAGRVVLIESSTSACADARENLQAPDFAGRATVDERPFGAAPLPRCDLLLADPPRAGLLADGAAAVLANAPPRILLVSCSLPSLGRDLQALASHYRVRHFQLCDLFPHTEHVEALTLLERR